MRGGSSRRRRTTQRWSTRSSPAANSRAKRAESRPSPTSTGGWPRPASTPGSGSGSGTERAPERRRSSSGGTSNGHSSGLGPEPRPPEEHVWYRHSRDLTLILGLPELVEPKGILPPYAVRVGPTVWEPPLEVALPEWVERLGRERPAVLASVSTVGAMDAQLVREVGQAVDGEDLDVVLTVAAAGALPPLPENVRIVRFIPHGVLLPRVAAVVSHAGNGTVTRAACAGVPLLLLPDGKDQFDVARGAAAAGIALVLDREDADATRVRITLRTLLDEPEFRTRARQLAQRAAHDDAAATAAEAVERLLASPVATTDGAASFR